MLIAFSFVFETKIATNGPEALKIDFRNREVTKLAPDVKSRQEKASASHKGVMKGVPRH